MPPISEIKDIIPDISESTPAKKVAETRDGALLLISWIITFGVLFILVWITISDDFVTPSEHSRVKNKLDTAEVKVTLLERQLADERVLHERDVNNVYRQYIDTIQKLNTKILMLEYNQSTIKNQIKSIR